jgi:hypothetical protein
VGGEEEENYSKTEITFIDGLKEVPSSLSSNPSCRDKRYALTTDIMRRCIILVLDIVKMNDYRVPFAAMHAN